MKALIGVNVVMFFVQLFVPSVTLVLGLRPVSVVGSMWVWQVATYMFLHGGLFHILFNMLALWMFGVELERRWGTRFFVKFYFVTGIGAGVITVMLSLLPFGFSQDIYRSVTIGASGAIYGLLLAYAMYFPDRPIYLYLVFPVPAKWFVAIMGLIAFYGSVTGAGGLANATHLAGLLVAYVYLKTGRSMRGFSLHPWAEVKYRYLKWKIGKARKKFDVHVGGRSNDWNRRVH